jgi:hypothetical protein
MNDFLLDSEYNLVIVNGDFVLSENEQQDISLIISESHNVFFKEKQSSNI